MSTANSINHELPELTIDQGSGLDSFVQFSINGTGEFRIGNDSTDDSFRMSQGSALGTNDTFLMSSNGELTLPLQPSFLATINSESNASGDGTAHSFGSITATTEVFDQSGDFTVGNGAGTGAVFTAPVTGRYFLSLICYYDFDTTTGGTIYNPTINTSNRTYFTNILPTTRQVPNFYGPNTYLGFSASVIADMDASDTAEFKFSVFGGSKTDDVVSGQISGCLLV